MKHTLLSAVFIALLSFIGVEKTNAQVTGVTVTISDSLFTNCILPNNTEIMINGTLTGTVTAANDTVTIYVNFGDGSDTTYNVVAYISGSLGYFYPYLAHTYTMPGTYAPYVLATAMGGATGSASAIPVTLSNDCATLQGKLYVDGNSNCSPDAGEIGISYVPIWLVNAAAPTDTTWAGWTDDTGHYAINVLPGTYTILADAPSYYGWYWWGGYGSSITPTCPSSGTYSLTAAASTNYTENFAFNCATVDTFDMHAYGWNYSLVRGDTTWVEVEAGDWWWYWGFTCSSLSTTVTLTLDPHLHYVGVSPYWGVAPTSVSGSTITWNVSSASSFFGFWSMVKVYCDSATTIGDTLCNTVYAAPTSLVDPDLTNNTMTFCGPVRASFDPNGLAVAPQGTGAPGYIDNQTNLTYEIHFQNTGTAPATNITVNDTLSSNIDMNTLHIIKSSAPVELYTSGNAVKFRFNNINLPDSISNPAGSIGTISFGALPKSGLAPNTPIPNRASIYFDYNPPVVTNSVLNTIRNTTGVQHLATASMAANVYPNPADNSVYAKTDDKSDFTMTMTDILGRTVATNKSVNGSASVNTQTLSSGLYIINLTNSIGKVLTTKVTVQH